MVFTKHYVLFISITTKHPSTFAIIQATVKRNWKRFLTGLENKYLRSSQFGVISMPKKFICSPHPGPPWKKSSLSQKPQLFINILVKSSQMNLLTSMFYTVASVCLEVIVWYMFHNEDNVISANIQKSILESVLYLTEFSLSSPIHISASLIFFFFPEG